MIEINGVKLYDVNEVGKMFNTTGSMIRNYKARGYIEATMLGNKNYFTIEQIESGRKAIAKIQRGPINRFNSGSGAA